MNFLFLTLAVLSCWRVTHLFNAEDGPGDVLAHLRRAAGEGFFGKLLDCFYCLSLWVAAPIALLGSRDWKEWLLSWLATSGGAILLERATAPPPTVWHEEEP